MFRLFITCNAFLRLRLIPNDGLPDSQFVDIVIASSPCQHRETAGNPHGVRPSISKDTKMPVKTSGELFAWLNTVNCLYGSSSKPFRESPAVNKRGRLPIGQKACDHAAREAMPASVRIVDRLTQSTAVIEWCDSTSCRYGSQLWRVAKAERAGICALTGTVIKSGDSIYRPRRCREKPQNAAAMICAAFIEEIPCDIAA